ncbi:hypothetical protein B296_00054836, partial [Ensete ventricosum]
MRARPRSGTSASFTSSGRRDDAGRSVPILLVPSAEERHSWTTSLARSLPEEVERPLVCCCLLVEEAAIKEVLLGQRSVDEAGKSERCAVIGQRRRDGRKIASALLPWLEEKCRGWAQMRVSTAVDQR